MKILILDSGVFLKHPSVINERIEGYRLIYDEEKEICIQTDDIEDYIGHGTAVYNLIHKNCSDADVKIVKIFDKELEITEEAFIKMLAFIRDHEKPDILNLSLGISRCENIKALYEVCKEIQQKGIIIFSAFGNDGSITYPAAFDCVYGVTGIPEITRVQDVLYIENSYVNLCAKGTACRLAWKQPDYIFLNGNSFSCAIAAAKIAKDISNSRIDMNNFPIIGEQMKIIKDIPFKINKAVIFPFNKEMHSLIRYYHLLSFEITNIYDHKYSGHVNADINNLMDNHKVGSWSIKDISEVSWDEIDTLILGHIEEISSLTHDDTLKEQLINTAKKRGVNVYAFDPLEQEDGIFSVTITEHNLPSNHFNKLFKISKPVLGVWGTSSRQGKFTLQLKLREMFLNEGYRVGQLGTEPSSLLFGMDGIFPYGYNCGVKLTEGEALIYINRLMNQISAGDCDIIIVGAQSAAISYDISNVEQFVSYQHVFLCATCPDAVILTISPQDSIEYIKNTIQYIENVSSGKVIALCLFPKLIQSNQAGFYEIYKILTYEELSSYKENFIKNIGIDTYILEVEEDMEGLLAKIIDYF